MQLEAGGAGSQWVLARGLCSYAQLDGAAVPARKRKDFVDMAVRRATPFADPQWHVQWVGERAMVWSWSRAEILRMPDGSTAAAPVTCLPESLFRGAAQEHGAQLIAMDAGVEGRVWQEGVLRASHWWAQSPSLAEWNGFLRGAGVATASALPDVEHLALANAPWASSARGMDLQQALGGKRQLLVAITAGVVACAFGILLSAIAALQVSIMQVDRDIAQREAAAEKIITARASAQADRDQITGLLDLLPPAGQLQLMAAVDRALAGDWQLSRWNMPDKNTLEVDAILPAPDPRAAIAALESGGRFREASAQLGERRGEIKMRAKIVAPVSGAAP